MTTYLATTCILNIHVWLGYVSCTQCTHCWGTLQSKYRRENLPKTNYLFCRLLCFCWYDNDINVPYFLRIRHILQVIFPLACDYRERETAQQSDWSTRHSTVCVYCLVYLPPHELQLPTTLVLACPASKQLIPTWGDRLCWETSPGTSSGPGRQLTSTKLEPSWVSFTF